MSYKSDNIIGDLLNGIEKFEEDFNDPDIQIKDWILGWSKDHNTIVLILHASRPPIVFYPEVFEDYLHLKEDEKNAFCNEVKNLLNTPINGQ